MNTTPITIFLWAIPRSVSTAFFRCFETRSDTKALSGPFTDYCYLSNERVNNRFSKIEPEPEHSFEAALSRVFAPSDRPIVFVKDIAFHVKRQVDHPFIGQALNTFITRDPLEACTSHYQVWQDYDFEETGYLHQERLFDRVVNQLGQKPIVVNGTWFRQNPEGVMRAYCEQVGVSYRREALSWQRKQVGIGSIMKDFHEKVSGTTRILEPTETSHPDPPAWVHEMAAQCRPYYEILNAHAIKPNDNGFANQKHRRMHYSGSQGLSQTYRTEEIGNPNLDRIDVGSGRY